MRETQRVADPLIRRDAWGLEEEGGTWHPIMEAYALAVGVMQGRPRDDATSWTYQAAVHGVASGEPVDDFVDQCQHNTWHFLPWHRIYLHLFERIVRQILSELDEVSDDVKTGWALPYWNYDRGGDTAALPTAFREATLSDGQTPNPLFTELRDPNLLAGGQLHPLQVTSQRALAEGFFSSDPVPGGTVGFGGAETGWNHFRENPGAAPGALEQTPHNVVHGAVGGPFGGLMGAFDTAPLDPIFWLHHSNIDRLWVVWLGQDGRENPTGSGWTDLDFDFKDESGTGVRMRASQVLDPATLGYEYEEPAARLLAAGAEGGSSMPTEPPADRPPELVGATEQPLTLTGEQQDVEIPVGQPTGPSLLSDSGEPERVFVNVEGIEGDANPGLSYAVYVNLPDDQDPDTAERYHVGNLSFFGIERARDTERDHPGGHGLRYAFDITDLAKALREEDRWDPDQLRITFSPIRPLPPEGQEAAPEPAGPPVTIGRVGIYYQ